MRTPALFKEYIWLVNTIHSAKRISFAEINERWLRTAEWVYNISIGLISLVYIWKADWGRKRI